MNVFRPRPVVLPPLALLLAAVGCSSADGDVSAAVPNPSATVTELCRNLDRTLPSAVDGAHRRDPSPASALTAGWGNPAIILRCGVERPPKMIDPKVAEGGDPDAVAGGVNGVDWLMEKQDDGTTRLTTASRLAYVQVTVPGSDDVSGVLVDLAASVKKAIPEGIAS